MLNRKWLSVFALLVLCIGLGTTQASAAYVPIYTSNNNFTMLDPYGAVTGGTNDVTFTWDGTLKTAVAASLQVSNATIASPCPFNGFTWKAHDVAVYGPGTYTVKASCAPSAPGCATGTNPITFTVGPDEIGAHILFDWGTVSTNKSIDVVNVWKKNVMFGPSPMWTEACGSNPANKVWDLMSKDPGTGINGYPMVDGGFIGFRANFNIMGTFINRVVDTSNNNFTINQIGGLAFGGTNDVRFTWDGTKKTAVAASGQVSNATISSPCLFFLQPWWVHDLAIYGPGTYTVYTDCPPGSPGCGSGVPYTFTVNPGETGAHMLFSWNGHDNIDVVNVWMMGPYAVDPICTPTEFWASACGVGNPAQVWDLMSYDWDYDCINGAGMVDGPFPGMSVNFNLMGGGLCTGKADGMPCDTDGNPCSIERCYSGTCQFYSYLICESAWCARTTCDPAGGCITLEDKCDDGNPCNGREMCIGIGSSATCERVSDPPCDDHNVCTTDYCDTATGACTHGNNTLPCDDGNLCNGRETTCQDGVCMTGTPLNCDDGNVCTTDTCEPAIGCVHVATDRSGYIITVAGNGSPGYSGDNGPATSASLYGSDGVTVDSSGNIYIADTSNHRIRKVSTSGTITTVAGNGTLGYSGDNGPATYASLNYPSGVAVDSSGNIYIADQYNNRIRKVDTNGIITLVAGNGTLPFSGDNGPATAASLYHPTGVAVDPSGNIYIADSEHNRIRKVDTSGTITTVAGNGLYKYSGDNGPATSASLFGPFGITMDTAGNIYFADYYNTRIRKVNTSGIITTVAGNGTAGYSGDNGQATSASLYFPRGVAVDTSGNIYIADQYNHRIRRVDTSGIISTVVGNGAAGDSGDNGPSTLATLSDLSGVAVDSSGNIFIADTQNNRIRKVTWSLCNPCAGQPNGTPCNDNNACTANDVCTNENCMGTVLVCNDNNTCTTDACNAAIGACEFTPLADGTACTVNIQPGTCASGQCIPYPVCPAGSVKSVTIRGGGQKAGTVDLQIQTNFMVVNGGCIVGSTASTVTCSPGTSLLVDVKAGRGPMPTSCTWKGAPISTDSQLSVTCPATSGDVGKLICDNKLGGGKDVDKMTITVP